MRNSGQHARAFVVQLDPTTDPTAGRFEGRVEHVASGRVARFASPDEFLAFVARVLAIPDDPGDESGA
jgi:hypothetical protein